MLLLSRRLSKTDSSAGNRSIGRSLVLYWLCMALAMLAAALLLLSVTGVLSRTARQFGETAALQQNNTAALFTAQMDALSAQGIELSETVSGELERFLASRSLSFDALNDDPALIAELESLMIPALETTMAGSTCSGVYFCLDATANTTLPVIGIPIRSAQLGGMDALLSTVQMPTGIPVAAHSTTPPTLSPASCASAMAAIIRSP